MQHQFKNLEICSRNIFDPLYHYTSIDTLQKILMNNTLWAKNCQFYIDKSETRHMERLYKKLISNRKIGTEFLQFIKELNEEDNSKLKVEREQTYIFSLTDNEKSKKMWKKYGKNGIAIEFKPFDLIENYFNNNDFKFLNKDENRISVISDITFGKVKYDDIKVVDLLHDIYLSNQRNYDEDIIKSLRMYLKFDGMRYFKKEKKYDYENEYRLVIKIDDNDNESIRHYYIDNNPNAYYIKIFFNSIFLLIDSIIINPKINKNITEENIRKILKKYHAETINIRTI